MTPSDLSVPSTPGGSVNLYFGSLGASVRVFQLSVCPLATLCCVLVKQQHQQLPVNRFVVLQITVPLVPEDEGIIEIR